MAATTAGTSMTDALKHLSNKAKGFWAGPYENNYSPGLIAHYWLAAGGNPKYVNQAVAASLAESNGNPGSVSGINDNGTRDVGLWQINSVHGPGMASLDPLTNARAAVHLSANGTDWSPWCTSYDDGVCHGSTSNPHYRGAGRGNRLGGSPVLGQAALDFLYAKDAIAGAYYGAQSAGGTVAPLTSWGDPVTTTGATAVDSTQAAVDNAINKDTGGAWGVGNVGTILAYIGYGLLAAFGAALMLLALAILVLALVERQQALAAIPGVGKLAGAASEAGAQVQARSTRNQASGAQSFRGSRPGRRMAGDPKSSSRLGKGSRPTAGGNQRRARVHDVGVNPRPRHGWQVGGSGRPSSGKPAPF